MKRVMREEMVDSRSPHGERGLKFVAQLVRLGRVLSIPAWGAWIEI